MKSTYNITSRLVHESELSPDQVELQIRKEVKRIAEGMFADTEAGNDLYSGFIDLYPEFVVTSYDDPQINKFQTAGRIIDRLQKLPINTLKEIFHIEIQPIPENGTTHFRLTFGNSNGTRQEMIEKGQLIEKYLI